MTQPPPQNPHYAAPPQGYPQHSYPQQGYPQQGYPQQQPYAQPGGVQPGYSSQPYPAQAQGGHGGHHNNQPAPSAPTWYQPPESKESAYKMVEQFKVEWETPLLLAGFKQPLWCCGGFFCAPCAVFFQRRKLLMADKNEDNWKYYQCCGGIWGRSLTSKCNKCTDGKGCLCMALEGCCCAGCAAHGNRFMIQLHYGLENTCCDIFLFYLSCICQIIACILQDDTFSLLADLLYYLLIGCMTAQHENEMAVKGYPKIEKYGGPAPIEMV